MSDVVSLELLLDEEGEAGVRAEWVALAEAGLSSMAAHPSPSNRPHITLLVRPRLPPFATGTFSQQIVLPVPVTLGAPLLFGSGDRRVLARSVVASSELLDLHRAVHRLVGAGDDAAHTRPGDWMPHVTLARRIRLDSLPQALRILDGVATQELPGAPDLPGSSGGRSVAAVAIRRWDSASATVTELQPGSAVAFPEGRLTS